MAGERTIVFRRVFGLPIYYEGVCATRWIRQACAMARRTLAGCQVQSGCERSRTARFSPSVTGVVLSQQLMSQK